MAPHGALDVLDATIAELGVQVGLSPAALAGGAARANAIDRARVVIARALGTELVALSELAGVPVDGGLPRLASGERDQERQAGAHGALPVSGCPRGGSGVAARRRILDVSRGHHQPEAAPIVYAVDMTTLARLQLGFLVRLASRPDAGAFALRGGMRIAQDFQERVPRDIDLVTTLPLDRNDLTARLGEVLAQPAPDLVSFDAQRFRVDVMPGPDGPGGVRLVAAGTVDHRRADLAVDVQTGAALWPRASWRPLRHAPHVRLPMAAPESLVGRKLQITVARGPRHWRPKDLADLQRLLRLPLARHRLRTAIELALHPHAELAQAIQTFQSARWWSDPHDRLRWNHFTHRQGPSLADVVAEVQGALAPVLGRAS